MVAPPRERRFAGPAARPHGGAPGANGNNGNGPGTAGTAKPKASKNGSPAESGENPAPGAASGTAIVDTSIEENVAYETKASKKKVAKCEENPGTADRGDGTGVGRGGEGGGKVSARGGTAATGRRRPRWTRGGTVRRDENARAVRNFASVGRRLASGRRPRRRPPPTTALAPPVLALFARVPSLGAPHHSEQARSPKGSFGAAACSFTSKVPVEQSVGSIAACVNPRRQHEARHRNMNEPTPTTRSAASQRGSEPKPTTRSEASGQLLGLWFHELGPACWTLGVSGGAAQRAPMSFLPCRTPVQERCWGELRAPRVCVHSQGRS
jgi:hypothetical protein